MKTNWDYTNLADAYLKRPEYSNTAIDAMSDAGIKNEDVDLIIVATISPDAFFPSTACYVQKNIGAVNALCFDVSAACSGFLMQCKLLKTL